MTDDKELIKIWRKNHFTLRLYDTHQRDMYGKSQLAYQFKDRNKIIFEGSDFYPSPLYAIDSLECVYSLLGFLSLQYGDTDREYFDKYNQLQLNWMQSRRCDDLKYLVFEYEDRKG